MRRERRDRQIILYYIYIGARKSKLSLSRVKKNHKEQRNKNIYKFRVDKWMFHANEEDEGKRMPIYTNEDVHVLFEFEINYKNVTCTFLTFNDFILS